MQTMNRIMVILFCATRFMKDSELSFFLNHIFIQTMKNRSSIFNRHQRAYISNVCGHIL